MPYAAHGLGDVLFTVLLPAVGFVAQALFLPFVVAWRVVARRPWLVTARTEGPPIDAYAWDVVGLRASGRVVREASAAIGRGESPAPRGARSVPYGLRR